MLRRTVSVSVRNCNGYNRYGVFGMHRLFAVLEVSSRLWAGSVLGRRSARNTNTVINDVIVRGRLVGVPLIATDGFEDYFGAIEHLIGPACVYGQVIKTRRNNRVIRVDRRVKIGTASRLEDALWTSEDSDTLNTSFVERLNLTIRQGSAYLRRRSPCHARGEAQLRVGGSGTLRPHGLKRAVGERAPEPLGGTKPEPPQAPDAQWNLHGENHDGQRQPHRWPNLAIES